MRDRPRERERERDRSIDRGEERDTETKWLRMRWKDRKVEKKNGDR